MKKTIILFFFFLIISSCTIKKNINIEHKSLKQVDEFYLSKNIDNYLYLNTYNDLKTLYIEDRTTIPQNFIFNEQNVEIDLGDQKSCTPLTTFLKNYTNETILILTKYNLSDYINHFKVTKSNIKIDDITGSKKLKIFLNTATYGELNNQNSEAFKLYEQYHYKYDIYIVNIDLLTDWKDKI